MRSSTGSDSGIISEMLKTKSGKIGIAMLLALVLLSVSVLVSTPIDTLQDGTILASGLRDQSQQCLYG